MSSVPQTEVWQRGPIPGFDALLMPVVHALVQVREDLARLADEVPPDHVWLRPGGAASIGFHVRHTGGALDRLFTYARGEALTDSQKAALREEGVAGDPPTSLASVVHSVDEIIGQALQQLATTSTESLLEVRKLGRAGLPTTVLGLLFHAAEHSTRHVGQAITTAKIVASLRQP
jgi:hypothetical protein